ncbi:unnamed protein product [Sphacelaria rigidula]
MNQPKRMHSTSRVSLTRERSTSSEEKKASASTESSSRYTENIVCQRNSQVTTPSKT